MNRMMLTVWLGCSVASLAAAQLPADSDGDGAVSREEFLAAQVENAERRFAMLDKDADGLLSADELRPGRRGPHGRFGGRFADIDTDGDGAWSLAELQVVRPEITVEQFSALDANNDGLITAEERPMRRRPF